ncbi:MAG TPA: ribosome-associated translation inhibitor RaiA [Chthoniobacterales bacterium]|nr:ribosome-associated translation inhibitor RaiA [Chthoniobacterales bacterium]
MINLPIHITTHHLQLSDALRRFLDKKLTPVTRFANDALAADIVLRRHNGSKTRFSASGRLSLPGRDVHSRAIAADLYTAIGRLVLKLGRRLRKRKTRLGRMLVRQSQLTTSVSAAGQAPVLQAEPVPPPSWSRFRNKEGGQEMRVFPFRRRDAASVSL